MIYPYPKFLSKQECEEIINLSLPQLKPLTTYSNSSNNNEVEVNKDRVGDGCYFYGNEGIFGKIINNLSFLTNSPQHCIEAINVVRYKVGGRYDQHFDCFSFSEGFTDKIKAEGDRKYSCIIYLNENFSGGSTYFPNIGVEIHPSVGSLIIWSNLNSKGTPYTESLHAGMPVEEGEKWALVTWVREKQLKK